MSTTSYLDYAGLSKYNDKVQAQLAKKVDAVTGKGLSTEDYTTAEKEKLAGLSTYTLPAATIDALGGVMVAVTTDPVPTKTALKVDATGKAFVDWTEAPQASTSVAGLIKLGEGFEIDEDTGAIKVDTEAIGVGNNVEWSAIQNKPDLALKSDIAGVYNYKGSVATYDALPSTELTSGDVYNVESNDMNYAWTGTAWDPLGSSFSITSITDTEIDALFETEAP